MDEEQLQPPAASPAPVASPLDPILQEISALATLRDVIEEEEDQPTLHPMEEEPYVPQPLQSHLPQSVVLILPEEGAGETSQSIPDGQDEEERASITSQSVQPVSHVINVKMTYWASYTGLKAQHLSRG